jgi:D-glycero-D-manno-heptose 1,7-bisphosphate phosphatase
MQDGPAHGAHIDAFYYCPHHPEGTIKPLAVRCRAESQLRACRSRPRESRSISWRKLLIGDRDDDMGCRCRIQHSRVKFSPQTDSLVDVVRQELAKSSGLEDRLRS